MKDELVLPLPGVQSDPQPWLALSRRRALKAFACSAFLSRAPGNPHFRGLPSPSELVRLVEPPVDAILARTGSNPNVAATQMDPLYGGVLAGLLLRPESEGFQLPLKMDPGELADLVIQYAAALS